MKMIRRMINPAQKAKSDKSSSAQKTIDATPRQLKNLDTHQKWFGKNQGGQLGHRIIGQNT